MKKTKYLLIIAASCFLLLAFRQMNDDPKRSHQTDGYNSGNNMLTITSRQMSNNISTWYRTNGNFNRDPSTGNSGFNWPSGSLNYARYASGIWMPVYQYMEVKLS